MAGANKRRTDILIFLNGLPLVVMELKGPESKNADIVSAYNQIQTYKADIPALFRTNLMSVLSDGFAARYGTLSADFDRHMAWRTVDGEELVDPKSLVAWETLVRGLLRRDVLLDLLRYFTVFENDGRSLIKKTAGYHQYHAAKKGLKKVLKALKSDGKAGETKSRTRTNVVKNRQFSERIEDAMARYHNRVIDALQVIEELIKIGRDLREEPDDGLTPEEVAFYDALAENGSAVELMGNADLRLIASELVKAVRENAGIDWWHFDQRRKKVRITIRRILRKYGYPPDLEDAAIRTVVLQAEALAAEVKV